MTDSMLNLMPAEVPGWGVQEEDQFYDKSNLYEYIDGGAELFLSYQFKSMMTRIYGAEDQPDIIVDLFDMGTVENAYGVFSFSRENPDSLFGTESQYVKGLLLFWKDRYYVSILFNPETPEAKYAAFKIAEHIDRSITGEGKPPALLDVLPQDGLLPNSIRFFRHPIWTNTYHFISNENILNIDENTPAVLAKYKRNGKNHIMLLIQYPTPVTAAEAYKKFVLDFLKTASAEHAGVNQQIRKLQDKWYGCQTVSSYLIIVLESVDQASCKDLINLISEHLK